MLRCLFHHPPPPPCSVDVDKADIGNIGCSRVRGEQASRVFVLKRPASRHEALGNIHLALQHLFFDTILFIVLLVHEQYLNFTCKFRLMLGPLLSKCPSQREKGRKDVKIASKQVISRQVLQLFLNPRGFFTKKRSTLLLK